MLTKEMIEFLLNELSHETVIEGVEHGVAYRVQRQRSGYRSGMAGITQAALSVGLEAERERPSADRGSDE